MTELELAIQIRVFHITSVVCLILFILVLVVDIMLFVRLRIWDIIGELSGRSEKRFIEQLRSEKGKIHEE